MFSLTTTHLRFLCEATTPLRLEVENFRAGQNLRGALGQVMTRTYCAHSPLLSGEGQGVRSCPVHWLLAANEKPGEERRGYALVPPAPGGGDSPNRLYESGERFEFGITLFGNARKFLPYFVLAIPEMGRLGVGPGRGKFELKSVWAVNPFSDARECLLAEGENLVHTPTLTLGHAAVIAEAERWMGTVIASREAAKQSPHRGLGIASSQQPLLAMTIQFLTPTRVIRDERTLKTPEFAPLFASLLKRLDDLEEQFASFDSAQDRRGGSGRPHAEIQSLHAQAACAQLIEADARWVEVWSGSTRSGKATPLSGFVGRAVYAASPDIWRALLPWLLWAQLAQVGKDTVKGNGVMQVTSGG